MAKENIYSVGQINSYIKNLFDEDFMLQKISIRGEVSNCKYHTAGHIYFTLKDETGVISCIMFAGNRKGIAFHMQEGHKIIVSGKISVYTRDGSYQMYADNVRLDGVGQLYEKFEQLKSELEEMGMFAEEYKQPIPAFASKVGIVTAKTGAAVRDIIQISKRRNPYVQLILYPALVQGENAAQSIVNGIKKLDAMKPDVIIVGRGGGSIEDLWAFNEEIVARAIFDCETPVISAVGHETDITIADYVADLRAPTPSAAAELAVYEHAKVKEALLQSHNSLFILMQRQVVKQKSRLEQNKLKLKYASPISRFNKQKEQVSNIKKELMLLMEQKINSYKVRLKVDASKLDSLSPLKKLAAGYSFITVNDEALTSVKQTKKGDELKINVSDGTIKATVVSKRNVKRS